MLKKPHFPRQCQKKKKQRWTNEQMNYLHAIDNIYTLIHKLRGHLLLWLSINIFHFLHSRPLLASTWHKGRRLFLIIIIIIIIGKLNSPSVYSLLIFFIPDQFCSCLCSDGGNSWQNSEPFLCLACEKAPFKLVTATTMARPSFWFCLAGFSCYKFL